MKIFNKTILKIFYLDDNLKTIILIKLFKNKKELMISNCYLLPLHLAQGLLKFRF